MHRLSGLHLPINLVLGAPECLREDPQIALALDLVETPFGFQIREGCPALDRASVIRDTCHLAVSRVESFIVGKPDFLGFTGETATSKPSTMFRTQPSLVRRNLSNTEANKHGQGHET